MATKKPEMEGYLGENIFMLFLPKRTVFTSYYDILKVLHKNPTG